MESKYLLVCSCNEAIEEIHVKKIYENLDKLNEYINQFDRKAKITFDPYRFLANYSENSDHYINKDGEIDIIKICHCWITYGYKNNLKLSSFNHDTCVNLLKSPKICFITSMTKDMYNLFGETMIVNLLKHTEHLHKYTVVYSENFEITKNNIYFQSLKDNEWLNSWLEKNDDIIPVEYGGSCKEKMGPFKYNASKFIKKVASIKHAKDTFLNAEYYVWIDCDCLIKGDISYDLIDKSFSNCNFFYHQGINRDKKAFGIETGVFGFDKNAFDVIDKWCEYFESQNFRKMRRWDDGFILKHIIYKKFMNKKSNITFNDLVPKESDWVHPLKSSIWNQVIEHNKGEHYRKNVHKNVKN